MNGGTCKKMKDVHPLFRKNPDGSLDKFKSDAAIYKKKFGQRFGWTEEEFEGFEKFEGINEDDFEYAYGCSNIKEKPEFFENCFLNFAKFFINFPK